MRKALHRLARALLRTALPRDLRDPVLGDLDDEMQERLAAGDTPQQAGWWAARQSLGSLPAALRLRTRRPAGRKLGISGGTIMLGLWQDVRYSARMMRRHPVMTCAAIATLALGIGGTTAIFSVTHAVLLRPLPYPDSNRLVVVGQHGRASTDGYTTFLDWRERTRSFERMAAMGSWSPTLETAGGPERLQGLRVTHGFFEALGVRPALGRLFTEADDRPGEARRVALLSDSLWRQRFGAAPDAVGRAVRINGVDYRIIGVLPAGFEPLMSGHFYNAAAIWSPLGYDVSLPYACRSCQHLRVMGRLRQGVTPDIARAELDAIQRNLLAEHPNDYSERAMAVIPLQDELVRNVRATLEVLFGAIVFVLAIAVANLTSLLLARAAARRRELALRSALGAGRRRIIRQLLTEGVLLAAIGGGVGLVIALWATPMLVALAPAELPRAEAVRVDRVAVVFAAAITRACGILVGLAPALRMSRPDLSGAIKAGDRGAPGGGSRHARAMLVAAEVALAVVLLAGAGLMLRTMTSLQRVDPGFEPEGVLALRVSAVGNGFDEVPRLLGFQRDLLDRVRALPGVEAAALASQIPFGDNSDRYGLDIEARPGLAPADRPALERYAVTPGYFEALRIPLRHGRLLTDRDTLETEPVVVVNEAAARRIWPDADPIGQRVRLGGPDAPFRRIVGIAGDVRHGDLSAAAPMQLYLPQTQMTDAFLTLVVRASIDPGTLTPAVRREVAAIAPAVPVYEVSRLQDLIARSVAERQFLMRLLAALAGLALLLAAIGVYGMLAWWVTDRLPDMAIRIALGARPRQIVRIVFAHGASVVAAGTVAGIAAAAVLTRHLESHLFGVSATDPATFAAIVMIVVGVGVAAHLLPARRAATSDPLVLLREQ
jgi:predicted permease